MIFHRDPGRPVTRHLSEDGSRLTVHIPMQLRKQGGRKLIVLPETASLPVPAPRRDDTLLKALARAHPVFVPGSSRPHEGDTKGTAC